MKRLILVFFLFSGLAARSQCDTMTSATFTAITTNSVNVSFTVGGPNWTSFNVSLYDSATGFVAFNIPTLTTFSFSATGLTAGRTYILRTFTNRPFGGGCEPNGLLPKFRTLANIGYTPMIANGYAFKRISVDSTFHVPLQDTFLNRGVLRAGAIVHRPQDSSFWGWNGRKWGLIGGASAADLALKENISNKVNVITTPNDTTYPTTGAVNGFVASSISGKIDMPKDSIISQVPQFDYAKNIFGTEYLISLHNAIAAGSASEIWFGGTSQIIYHEPTGSPVNVVKSLAERNGYNANITFYNGAVGGSSTEDFILNKLTEIQARQPKAVVISHEINDGAKNVTLSNRLGIYERRMDTILSALRNGGNGITTGKDVTQLSIVLVTSSATNDYLYNRDSTWYIQANQVLRKMARKYKCAFVDTWNFLNDANSTWMDAPFAPGNPEIGIHPTPVANRWIGGMIYDALFPKGLETYAAANSLPTFFQLANISGNDSLKSVSASPATYIYGISFHRTTDAPYNGSLYTFRHKDDVLVQYNVGYANGKIAMRAGWNTTWYAWQQVEEINNPAGSDSTKSVTASPATYPYGVSLHRTTDAPLDGALFTQRQKDNISVQINSGYLDGRTSIRTGWGNTWYKWYKFDSLGINLNYQLVNAISSDSVKSVTALPNTFVLGSSFHRTTDAPNDGSLYTFRQRDNVNLQINAGFANGRIAMRVGGSNTWGGWNNFDTLNANVFKRPSGTATQFLKGDGSVDVNSYANLNVNNLFSQPQTINLGNGTGTPLNALRIYNTAGSGGSDGIKLSFGTVGNTSLSGETFYQRNGGSFATNTILRVNTGATATSIADALILESSLNTRLTGSIYSNTNTNTVGVPTFRWGNTFSILGDYSARLKASSLMLNKDSLPFATAASKITLIDTVTGLATKANIGTGLRLSSGTLSATTSVFGGSVSASVTAVTTFVVTIPTQANNTYQVVVQPTSADAASHNYYVANKTTTSFDLIYTNNVTGTVAFDWILKP